MEADKCDAIGWFALDGLPEPMVAYCRAGIDAYRAGAPVALHFQEPGDAIAYDPAADRLTLVPGHTDRGVVPEDAVRAFVEQAVGRITTWSDVSWARAGSRVWRVRGAEGGTWYVKIHQNDRFHEREVAALRGWVVGLGAAAPRLVAADAGLRTVVLTEVGGRSLHGSGRHTSRRPSGTSLSARAPTSVSPRPAASWPSSPAATRTAPGTGACARSSVPTC